jgi:hypothetical protein
MISTKTMRKPLLTPGRMILLAVAAGGLLAASALSAFWAVCWAAPIEGIGLCSVVKKNPPWFILSALAAVPAVLLTWYWQDQHKRSDLAFGRLQRLHQDFGSFLQHAADAEHPGLQAAAVLALAPYVVGDYEFSSVQHPFRRAGLTAIANALRSSSRSEQPTDVADSARLVRESAQAALELCRDHLRGIVLVGASMHCPSFRGADLREAHLEQAVLWRANLRDARLDGAYLAFTCLYGADLRGSTIAKAYCVDARYDDRTSFPETFDPDGHGMVRSSVPHPKFDDRDPI